MNVQWGQEADFGYFRVDSLTVSLLIRSDICLQPHVSLLSGTLPVWLCDSSVNRRDIWSECCFRCFGSGHKWMHPFFCWLLFILFLLEVSTPTSSSSSSLFLPLSLLFIPPSTSLDATSSCFSPVCVEITWRGNGTFPKKTTTLIFRVQLGMSTLRRVPGKARVGAEDSFHN